MPFLIFFAIFVFLFWLMMRGLNRFLETSVGTFLSAILGSVVIAAILWYSGIIPGIIHWLLRPVVLIVIAVVVVLYLLGRKLDE